MKLLTDLVPHMEVPFMEAMEFALKAVHVAERELGLPQPADTEQDVGGPPSLLGPPAV